MQLVKLKPGKSVNGNPIPVYTTKENGSQYVYLIAGTHGDEPEGVYILEKLVARLTKRIESFIPLVIIPLHNPDGYSLNQRTNANGVDLNRNMPTSDWVDECEQDKYHPGHKPLSEPESIFLDSLFKKYPPRFVISLHSWTPFINCNGSCRKEAEILSKYNGYKIVEGDIPDHTTPGSIGTYVPEKYSSPVLTVEYPEKLDELALTEILDDNLLGLEKVLESFKES